MLLEGPAGSGKTQLALSVAAAGGTHVERLQCYRGVTEDNAIGRFDEGLQRLYMEFSKGQHESWQSVQANLKGRDFFRPGPLMRALECDRPCVLLIDELDKVDEGFEAMLLEILSGWTLSIPEFGTVTSKSIPFVVLTSNEERRLGDPIRRRSLYVRVEHPTPEREAEIIASRTPKADRKFHREMAGIALSFRNYSLEKPPSVSEMIDFANALQLLGTDHVTEEHRDVLLPFLAKTDRNSCWVDSRRETDGCSPPPFLPRTAAADVRVSSHCRRREAPLPLLGFPVVRWLAARAFLFAHLLRLEAGIARLAPCLPERAAHGQQGFSANTGEFVAGRLAGPLQYRSCERHLASAVRG